MKTNCTVDDIGRFIASHDSFAVISHVSPDGDTVGSALALCRMLRAMGKTADPVCDCAVPEIYRFLPGWEEVKTSAQLPRREATIAVDCADKGRMGAAADLFDAAADTLEIDHHETNTGYAALDYIHGCSAAAGLVLWQTARTLGWPMDDETVKCLFTAILTDTGGFAYSNTGSEAFAAAAEMLGEHKVDVAEINRLVYRTVPLAKTKLLGRAIEKSRLYCNNRIAVSSLTLADRYEFGALGGDFDGIVEHLRDISTVEIAIFVRETVDGQKASLRSEGELDVSAISAAFGGGGHRNAAGLTSKTPIDELTAELTRLACELLEDKK